MASHHKTLWYDEIFTVLVATQPTWHKFVQAMPADGNPPLYALLTRLSIHLFGLTDLAVRLPSMVAFLAALAGVYVFVRRECGVVFGLLAVLLTYSEPGWAYSIEARPYALLLAFMMLALVSWQSATRAVEATPRRPRRLALAGMVIGIVGSILSHNIGIIEVGVPLLFGEAVRLYHTRRPDWPILATALAAIPTLAVTWPMMHRTHDLLLIYSQAAMSPLTLAKLHAYWISNPLFLISWPGVVSSDLIMILAIAVFANWVLHWLKGSQVAHLPHAQEGTANTVPSYIVASALGASLLIPVTMLALMFSSGYYICRYGIGCIAGIAMLACFLLARRGQKQIKLCMSVILLVLLVHGYAHIKAKKVLYPTTKVDTIDPVLLSDTSGLPVVISNPLAFLPTWWHAPASMKSKFVYLADTPTALQYGYVVPEVALMAEKPFLSAPLEDYSAFLSTHDHFRIYLDSAAIWPEPFPAQTTPPDPTRVLKERLENAGYRATLLHSDEWNSYYDMQRANLGR
jgi:hypothetical protein